MNFIKDNKVVLIILAVIVIAFIAQQGTFNRETYVSQYIPQSRHDALHEIYGDLASSSREGTIVDYDGKQYECSDYVSEGGELVDFTFLVENPQIGYTTSTQWHYENEEDFPVIVWAKNYNTGDDKTKTINPGGSNFYLSGNAKGDYIYGEVYFCDRDITTEKDCDSDGDLKAGEVGNWQCKKDSNGKIYQCEDGEWEYIDRCSDFSDYLEDECDYPYVSKNTVWDICDEKTTCTPKWECTSYSDCSSSGTQTRDCRDENGCGVSDGKPAESKSCTPPNVIIPCTSNNDCDAGEYCDNGDCEDLVCGDNEKIEDHSCVTIDNNGECSDNSDCNFDEYCDNEECVELVCGDDEKEEGHKCVAKDDDDDDEDENEDEDDNEIDLSMLYDWAPDLGIGKPMSAIVIVLGIILVFNLLMNMVKKK